MDRLPRGSTPRPDPPASVSTSPGSLLTTAASQPGKLPSSSWSILLVRRLTPTAGCANRPAASGHSPAGCVVLVKRKHSVVVPVAGHNASRAELPIAKHLWTGPCSPYAIHSQGQVPPMPHTCRGVFPICQTLAGACSPYAIHSQSRVPLYPTHPQDRVPLIPLARRSVSLLIPHSHRAELPSCQNRVKPSLIYFPFSGISKGIGFPQRKASD